MEGTPHAIQESRDELVSALGAQAVADASAVIMMFNVVDRVADATGIPIDEGIAHDLRHQIGEDLGMSHLAPNARSAH